MKLKKLSVKNFIGDLPRIINESLETIEKAFADIYDEETNTIGNDTANINCRTITVKGNDNQIAIKSYGNIIISGAGEDGKDISLIDLYERIRQLEYANENPTYSKSMLAKKKLQ